MASQDSEVVDESEDDQAEFDGVLVESAGELMPCLAKVLGGQKFAPYFAGLLPELLKKMVSIFVANLCPIFILNILCIGVLVKGHLTAKFNHAIFTLPLHCVRSNFRTEYLIVIHKIIIK